jgi:hypothetical protein
MRWVALGINGTGPRARSSPVTHRDAKPSRLVCLGSTRHSGTPASRAWYSTKACSWQTSITWPEKHSPSSVAATFSTLYANEIRGEQRGTLGQVHRHPQEPGPTSTAHHVALPPGKHLERGIKRLKSLLDLDRLRAREPSALAELYWHGKGLYTCPEVTKGVGTGKAGAMSLR